MMVMAPVAAQHLYRMLLVRLHLRPLQLGLVLSVLANS